MTSVALNSITSDHYLLCFVADVLLFFKYFDPVLKCIASVGHLYVPFTTKFGK